MGLSSGKARYILNLAEAVVSGELPLDEFDDTWDDQTITRALTAVKGIGVWTAEMFLIFVMNRPDVFPAGDLGVRVALRDRHGLAELPAPRDCHSLAELWRPYRTVASWYIWRGIDTPGPGVLDEVAESRSVSSVTSAVVETLTPKLAPSKGKSDNVRPDLEGRMGDRWVRWTAVSGRRGACSRR